MDGYHWIGWDGWVMMSQQSNIYNKRAHVVVCWARLHKEEPNRN